MRELQGITVVVKTYQRTSSAPRMVMWESPDGKRLLWRINGEENTFGMRGQQKVFKKPITPRKVWRWQVTDIDGKNERHLGIVPDDLQKDNELSPLWTPDSKGVHFIYNKKLWYLAVL